MKKYSIIIALFFFGITLNAQNKKGDVAINISGSPYPTTTNDADDFGALGLVGMEFFVSKKVSFAGNFFTSNNTLFSDKSGVTLNSYGFLPTVQYYFVGKRKFNVFGQVGYGFGFTDETRGDAENSALTIFAVGAGAHFRLSKKLNLKLFVPYFDANNITFDNDAADGVTVFLGFQFKL